MPGADLEDLLRPLAPQVLGALTRRYGHFDIAEDATQEALLAAATQWPRDGLPDSPRGWLITVGSRRMTDLLRSEQARDRREGQVANWTLPEDWHSPAADRPMTESDDTLVLLFMCCHPALSTASQIALTLRAVAGLTTSEVARALLVSEDTMTRRISRAKQLIKQSPTPFRLPDVHVEGRLAAVLHVLYLTFNEGYAATSGPTLVRTELSSEAIRLTRVVHELLPDDSEVAGLLALMLLTDARRPARTDADGGLVPMSEQDRRLWNGDQIAEGVDLISRALPRGPTGPYQLQAAIAAVHDEAPTVEETDWAQIVALYELLMQVSEGPVVALNHAVAVGMSQGPHAGLELLADLGDGPLVEDHRLHAVRAHLLEQAGDEAAARDAFETAAGLATSRPLKRYLTGRAVRLTPQA